MPLPAAAAPRKPLGPAVVELDRVAKAYTLEGGETVAALRSVSLLGDGDGDGGPDAPPAAVRAGEFVMIRGPSGGGKTSLLNLIGTLDSPSSGSVRLFGREVGGGAGGASAAAAGDAALAALRLSRIGFVFQSFNLLATLSAFENVELPMTLLGRLAAKERHAAALALLRLVGLEDRAQHLPSELSGGEQQRVAIARALANEPQLLLLDEPTGDLDTRNTVLVMDLLLAINRGRGMTCVMVTHNGDLECYADRVLFVADGRVVGVAHNSEQSQLEAEAYRLYLERDGDDGGDGGSEDGAGAAVH